jgi:hypothetical protein
MAHTQQGCETMPDKDALRYVTDAQGQVEYVLVPWDLWRRLEPQAAALSAPQQPAAPEQAPGPLADFDERLRTWDFRYPYDPAVACPHCGAATEDWRADPAKPFVLTNANIGGLLVFHCRACGTTIRQKHFRDHRALEHSTPHC